MRTIPLPTPRPRGGAAPAPRRPPGTPLRLGAIALALLAACASSSYAPRSVEPSVALQWPYAPQPAKLVYERSFEGFERTRRGLWRRLAGASRADADAFVLPVAIAVTPDGRMAVADLGRRCVHFWDPTGGRYLRLEGDPSRPLLSPVALAFDAQGGLWVADSAGAVVRFTRDGREVQRLERAGERPLGRPTGLAFDPELARLYVVDTLASRVDVFSADGRFERSFGGRGGEAGELNFPTHIARTATGELLVTDALNFRIQSFDADGRPTGAFGRHGDGSGDLALPKGVAVDSDGVVYVVDGLFDNVQLFRRDGEFLLTLGERGTGDGQFWLPSGIFLDAGGELYVCDTYNHRVQVFRVTKGYAHASS